MAGAADCSPQDGQQQFRKQHGLWRDSVRELPALAAQRQSRLGLIRRSQPITITCAVCGRVAAAASRFGWRLVTCSGTCRNLLWRQRHAEREIPAATSGPDRDPPAAGRAPGPKAWPSEVLAACGRA